MSETNPASFYAEGYYAVAYTKRTNGNTFVELCQGKTPHEAAERFLNSTSRNWCIEQVFQPVEWREEVSA